MKRDALVYSVALAALEGLEVVDGRGSIWDLDSHVLRLLLQLAGVRWVCIHGG